MKYKPGDKIRLKKSYHFDDDVKEAIDNLPDRIATIKKIDHEKKSYPYYMEEIKWNWAEAEIEKIEKIEEDEPIKNRFEILDL